MIKKTEIRDVPVAELRAVNTDEDKPKIEGYAAVFNSKSENLGGFREIIKEGAFTKTLKEKPDIRALWNHDSSYILGRTTNGSLTLEQDERGLKVSIVPPETQWAKDLMTSIERGDVNQMSFQFRAIKDEWRMEDGEAIRDLLEAELFEVSPVSFPAYESTSVSVRSYLENIGERKDRIEEIEETIEPKEEKEPFHAEHSNDTTSLGLRDKKLSLIEKTL